jgi:hypothetical protein
MVNMFMKVSIVPTPVEGRRNTRDELCAIGPGDATILIKMVACGYVWSHREVMGTGATALIAFRRRNTAVVKFQFE